MEQEKKEEKKEVKKGTWTKLGDNATFTSPSGKHASFDFSKMSNEVFAYYGKKQYLSDSKASGKGMGFSEEDQIGMMKTAYDDIVRLGVTLTPEGRVNIIGKSRSKAPRTQDAFVSPKLATYDDEQIIALHKTVGMGLVILSDTVKQALKERFQSVKPKGKK